MEQHLELEGGVALVLDLEHSLQAVFGESYAVDETEFVGPGFACFFAEVGGGESEVELDAVVAALGETAGF